MPCHTSPVSKMLWFPKFNCVVYIYRSYFNRSFHSRSCFIHLGYTGLVIISSHYLTYSSSKKLFLSKISKIPTQRKINLTNISRRSSLISNFIRRSWKILRCWMRKSFFLPNKHNSLFVTFSRVYKRLTKYKLIYNTKSFV